VYPVQRHCIQEGMAIAELAVSPSRSTATVVSIKDFITGEHTAVMAHILKRYWLTAEVDLFLALLALLKSS